MKMTGPGQLILPVLFLVLLFLSSGVYGISFFGEAKTGLNFQFPEGGGYESLLNPGNLSNIKDISMPSNVTAKLENQTERGGFALWLSLETLRNEGKPPATAGEVVVLDLMRLSYDWYINDSLRLSLGRQSFLTGYGYGWNPIDLANPLKDPSNPEQDLKGVDALSLTRDTGGFWQVRVYALFPAPESDGLAYEEVKAGTELTFQLPRTELKLTGIFGSAAEGIESYPSAAGIGFLMDIAGIGFYGEGAVREGSRTGVPGDAPAYALREKNDPVFSALAGIEYYFTSELSLTAEYYYNGEGFDQSERSDYKEALEYYNGTPGYAPEEYYALYRPGNFAQHYALLNLFYPLYNLQSELSVSIIASPDSGMFSISPEWLILPTGNMEISLSWSGLFSLDDGAFNEAWLAPVNNSAALQVSYFY